MIDADKRKIMDSNCFSYIARVATGQTDYVRQYYKIKDEAEVFDKNKIFNLQLRYWAEAKTSFEKLNKSNFILEEAVLIVNYLCSSLEVLAGVNIDLKEGNTPCLKKLYEKTLVKEKGWDLNKEKTDLFKVLSEEMNDYYTNICKHMNRTNSRRKMLEEITYEKVKKYMETTRAIWLWVLDKEFNGNIPEDQLVFFKEIQKN